MSRYIVRSMYYVAVITGLLVGLVLLLQIGLMWRMKRQVGHPAPDITSLKGRPLQPGERILIYFYSQHCRACKTVTPVVTRLAQQRRDVIAVDIGQSLALARDFGVMATPTVVLVRDGLIDDVRAGSLSERRIRHLLDPEIHP